MEPVEYQCMDCEFGVWFSSDSCDMACDLKLYEDMYAQIMEFFRQRLLASSLTT